MKVKFLFFLFTVLFFLPPTNRLIGQVTTTPTQSNVVLDAKAQARVDKEKVALAKNQQKLNKEMAAYEKAKMKFDKDLNAGKLSPRDKEKEEKKLSKANLSISKLKQKIAESEAFLAKYNL